MSSPVQDRVFNHTGAGTLYLTDIDVAYGNLVTSGTTVASGGCIRSSGSVTLRRSTVSHCLARTTNIASGFAYGGGIETSGRLALKYSTITDNATYSASGTSLGGGVFVNGGLTSIYSTISGNVARGIYGRAGGVFVRGSASSSISNSTISGNSANRDYGGLVFRGSGNVTLNNSTISGNHATNGLVGGIYSSAPLTIRNSTIAFNSAEKGRRGTAFPYSYYAPGLSLNAPSGPVTTTLQSTLISNNTYGVNNSVTENDVSAGGHAHIGNVTISGDHNFVRANFPDVSLPSGTLRISCPRLGPLRDNGGVTWTHQLLSGSPAIDAGANPSSIDYDQRGDSPAPGFARESPTGSPDIGAYEVQQDDIVFSAGFDGCPILL